MGWYHYYVNCDHIYRSGQTQEVPFVFYNSRIPPHGSIRREWITRGMAHGAARISFVEYFLEDDDPDGVWEAYGMKRESEYSFTVDAQAADPEKLFVYTLYQDGSLRTGFDVDTEAACAILTFPQPQSFTAAQLRATLEKIRQAPSADRVVEQLVIDDLLGGKTDVPWMASFQR